MSITPIANLTIQNTGYTILIVDDNPDNLLLMQLLLGEEGHTLQTADGAEAALAILNSWTPDAVLTDIQMPDIDGLELTRRIRVEPRNKNTVILAVSANALAEDIERAFEAGCNGYITKPVDTRTFGARVRKE